VTDDDLESRNTLLGSQCFKAAREVIRAANAYDGDGEAGML
jgi:hypothetical protein